MRFKPLLIATLLLAALLVTGCGSETPTAAPATPTSSGSQISIPEVSVPASQTNTPVAPATPDASPSKTPYPPPTVEAPAAPTAYPAPTDGEALLNERCVQCHNLDRTTSAKKSADAWKVTVDRMITKGAKLSPEEAAALIEYLAATYK